jgi:2-oxoglutarate dehydrogenase E1 component
MDKYSYLSNADVTVFDDLYQKFKNNPDSVDITWKAFFEGFEFQHADYSTGDGISPNTHKEFKVINLIQAYRQRGHLFTKTNPVRARRTYSPSLDIQSFGLTDADLDTVFQAGQEVGLGPATLRNIVAHLDASYCQSVGVEYAYIRTPERVQWIRDRVEAVKKPDLSHPQKLQIMRKLNQASVFEQFIHKKYVGQKRFSIEGAEALIPGLDFLIEKAATMGVREFVMGMAHRGRMNVLANIFNKTYESIFSEFDGKEYEDERLDGDVKYHMGYCSDVITDQGHPIRITLAPNPSHLEAVDPVVIGIARALIDHDIKDEMKVLPIMVHGDAAIAGQGVVYEVIQMAGLDGYRTGGTIHVVINNQVGFTTNYLDARTSTYCTDVAKTTLSPVFHVNGDDTEALVKTMLLALEYRQTFGMDVFIDLLCYRKYGHNEGDEPMFTQPQLYKIIQKHPDPRSIYLRKLIESGDITQEVAEQMRKEFDDTLQARLDESKQRERADVIAFLKDRWMDIRISKAEDFDASPETGYNKERLMELAAKIHALPEGKNFFRKITRLFEDRMKMVENDQLDWALGELLAYATLLDEGYAVRISGQDVERGTFSHRHAVVKTEDTEEEFVPLQNISDKQGPFWIYNSLLSEYAVMGFEYGYAFTVPNSLTIWEAQFGDFNNGAQIIIDQFISAAEDKWNTMNGLVLFLPHGYEGQGSEHSSARLERFLQLCAEENMQVCYPTTPANHYHMLRRQLHRDIRKPLVVMTPKKLLRYPKAVSSMNELANGRFMEVIDDQFVTDASAVHTIAFCSGKAYYEALERREDRSLGTDIALVRLEQLYPLPEKQLLAVLKKYSNAKRFIWLQEEPENMGAWGYVLRMFRHVQLEYVGPDASASPAPGSGRIFERRNNAIYDKLFSYALASAK